MAKLLCLVTKIFLIEVPWVKLCRFKAWLSSLSMDKKIYNVVVNAYNNTDQYCNTIQASPNGNVSSIHRSYRSMGHEFQSPLAYFSFQRSFDKSFIASDHLFLIDIFQNGQAFWSQPTVTVAVVITKVKVKKPFLVLFV